MEMKFYDTEQKATYGEEIIFGYVFSDCSSLVIAVIKNAFEKAEGKQLTS